jgi:DNA topoisomerase-1
MIFVIESPGKIKSFKRELSKIYQGKQINIMATNGRLFDLKDNNLGFDFESFEVESWAPVNEKIVNSIKRRSSNEDVLYLCTDNDLEGELIADHVASISNAKTIKRVYFNQIEHKHLKSAIENSGKVNSNLVEHACKKRIMDRAIGYGLSNFQSHPYAVVGRVLTPSLKALQTKKFDSTTIQLSPIDDSDISISFNIRSRNEQLLDQLEVAAGSFTKNDLDVGDVIISQLHKTPWDYAETLEATSLALNIGVDETIKLMQDAYEDGRLSYPRSDSKELSEEEINSLARQASYFGVSGFSEDRIRQRIQDGNEAYQPQKQGAHSALYPTDMASVPMHMRFKDLSTNQEKMLYLIAQNLFDAGSDIKKEVTSYTLKESSKLSLFFKRHGIEPSIDKVTIKKGARKHKVKSSDVNVGIGITKKKSGSFNIIDNNIDLFVFNTMVEAGIGRPSTWGVHTKKIVEKYIDKKTNALNKKGMNNIRYAEEHYRGLLDKDNYQKMDITLQTKKDFKEAILSSLDLINVSEGDLGELLIKKGLIEKPLIKEEDTYTPSL